MAQRAFGVDVSHLQGNVNWVSVANAGKSFAWVKATEGVTFTDSQFVNNENNGKAAGLYIGAYCFAHPESDSPASEASYFWGVAGNYIKNDGKTLMPVLDFETFTGTHVGASSYADWVNQWCQAIVNDAAAVGVRVIPVVYTSTGEACNLDGSVAQWYAWIAQPTSGGDPNNGSPWWNGGCEEWGTGIWDAWQYGGGTVAGVTMDLDVFNGTLNQLISTLVPAAVDFTTARESRFTTPDGRQVVFACGYPDGSVWENWETSPGGSWNGWYGFSNTGGFKRLDAIQNQDGTEALFGVGDGTAIWFNQLTNGVSWVGFQNLGGTFRDLKAFRYNDGRYAVFGMDGSQVWVDAQVAPNGAWGGWGVFPGGGFTQVSPILLPSQAFVMFGVGNGTPVWINTQTNVNSGWAGWQSLGGTFKNVRAFRYNDGRLSVFAGDGNLIWNNTQVSSNGVWSGWQPFSGGGITQYDPTKLSDERFSLLAVAGGSIWQNTQTNYNGGWTGWTNLGGSGFSMVNGDKLPDGRMYYFANAPGSPEWFRYQAVSNGVWNVGWTNLGGSVY